LAGTQIILILSLLWLPLVPPNKVSMLHHFSPFPLVIHYQLLPAKLGTAVAQWLRCYATNRKVTGLIPAGVIGFFIDIKSFRLHCGPKVDSASNRNEYQEYFLGVKAAGA